MTTENRIDTQVNEPRMNFFERNLFGVHFSRLHTLIPGLVLIIIIAVISLWISDFIGVILMGFEKSPISPVMICLILGLILNNIFKLPEMFFPGFKFSVKKLLRLGIILLGIRLSIFSVFELGLIGIPIVIACIFSALLITTYINKKLKQPKRLGTLIAVGTSICGVSAIVATSPVINANEEETAYAVAIITVFGLIATLIYPVLAYFLFGGNPIKAGLWLGTSIHDTSQVTGAAFIFADLWDLTLGLDVATITKLVRNLFMVFIIPLMAFIYTKSSLKNTEKLESQERIVKKKISISKLIPMFVIGFLIMSIIRSVGDAGINIENLAFGVVTGDSWSEFINIVMKIAGYLFVVSLGGVGLSTNFSKFKGLGIKPFLVGFLSAIIIGIVSFIFISIIGGLLTF